MKDTVDSRAVKIAAKIMQADGLCRQIVVLISVAEKPPEVHPVRLSVPAKCKPGFSATSPTLYRAVSGLSADNGEFADCP